MDAFAFGTRTTPEDSYKYAMGETVEYMGKPQKRIAPLDFLAVTDHAEYLGVVRDTIDPNGPFAKSDWYAMMTNPDPKVSGEAFKKLIGSTVVNKPLPEFNDPTLLRSAWEKYCGHLRQVLQARQVHDLHRLRVDLGAAVSEPASLRDLRRQRPGHALHGVRVSGSGRSLALPGSPAQTRPRRDRRSPQRQRQQRTDVQHARHVGQADYPRLRRAPHGQRTAGRDHSGQGTDRHQPRAFAHRRVRQFRNVATT